MTTSRREHPTQTTGTTGTTGGAGTTGAHRTRRRAPRTLAQRPPSGYEPYLDGLFTYALSVLRDHDVATAVLGDVLALAERSNGRSPSGEPERKAWLYALTRWSCLRGLAEEKRRRQNTHGGHQAHRPPAAVPEPELPVEESVARSRHADLTLLAWPEAAGTTPEQREALELAVRHTLDARQVAAVLGLDHAEARELLAAAACEVERTRAALIVVETGTCPTVTRLTGDDQVLLSTALRGELVRHVDDCPVCRRAAERAGAGGPWPGTGASTGRLPLVEAPRAAAYMAMLHAPRVPRSGTPRFDRGGFPLDPKDRAARRERLRTRALTTTVVATVVAAPVLALWAAYRGAPATGDAPRGASVTASEQDGVPGRDGAPYGGDAYENTGNAHNRPGPGSPAGSGARDSGQDVSVKVLTPGRAPAPGAGRLTVVAESSGHTTVVRLTVSGSGPVAWSMWANAPWLHLSRTSGTLAPGESFTVYITVDRDREPADPWTARLGVSPSGAVMTVSGRGSMPAPSRPPSEPGPGGTEDPGPGPDPTVPTTPPPSPSTPPPTSPPATEPPSTPPPSTPPPTDPPSPTPTQPPEPGPSGTS
ncbi:BACON domain-containing protein [Streptomyces sp. NPDC054863]